MQDLMDSHEVQRMSGVQSAMLTPKQIKMRFPWLNTEDIAGACLGLESEGWFDSWNLLQAVKLKNIHQGVDYIHGEMIYCKKHSLDAVAKTSLSMGTYEDGSPVKLGRNFEAHVLLPDSQQVYPLHFSTCIMAGGGYTGDMGRMAGIGEGYGVLGVEIPVERKRGYVYNVHCKTGPGLNCPLIMDPTGVFLRREGHMGDYLVGKLPDGKIGWSSCGLDCVFLGQDIPVNMHGDVDPDYWEQEILPTLQGRVDRLDWDEVVVGFINISFQVCQSNCDGEPCCGL